MRLYLYFFRTFIYEFLNTWGLGGNLHFLRSIFCCSIQRFYTNSHKSLILFYGSFLNFYTNSYKRIHTIVIQIILRIRTRCGFCTNSYDCYANCIVRIRIQCGFCTNSYNFYTNCIVRIHPRCDFFILFLSLPAQAVRNKLFGDTKRSSHFFIRIRISNWYKKVRSAKTS